jgi:signal transduction histidine kinase
MIGSLSRDLIDSLNDIVWAINPRRDRLSDLTYRMRRFASDCFTARDIHFRFSASDPQHDIKLGSDTRREVFLIFKEAVNNMVRHSGCTEADIRFAITHRRMELIVTDNGKGFDSKRDSGGNGLVNMRQRAAKLDGTLDIVSSRERGTTVSLMVPIK